MFMFNITRLYALSIAQKSTAIRRRWTMSELRLNVPDETLLALKGAAGTVVAELRLAGSDKFIP
jgi:hypothetical protein